MSKRRKSSQSRGGCFVTLLNLLTVFFLIGIAGVAFGFFTIFTNPQANPIPLLRPIFIPTVAPTLTPTITPQQLPPTFTPAPTNTPLPTATLRPSSTPIPTNTPVSLVTPPTADPNATATPIFPYLIQDKNPLYIDYNVINNSLGCNFMGVGGQIFDNNGTPKQGLIIELGGTIQGLSVTGLAVSGTAQSYGQAGYELPIADGPIASNKTLYVQLLDQSGIPISEKIFFDTFEDCEKNLILINFFQTR
ncbi:MAG TPA: hypothetical protein VI451_09870 [Anaerolineales bacterium]|nr:hypothetical protein [Anaerolineales bacterium]